MQSTWRRCGMVEERGALAEGFYWIAEKHMWGFEEIVPNNHEALRYYTQAANLGFSDANIRLGQLYEHGKGTSQNPTEALSNYRQALATGNWFAFASIALLLSRTAYPAKAEIFWARFFHRLSDCPKPKFLSETPGELIHSYLETQLRLGLAPKYLNVIRRHRLDLIGYHQRLLEQPISAARLDHIELVGEWMRSNL
jgi:hypothetical protein